MNKLKAKEIIKIMEEQIAPPHLAEDWDSPGLKTGSSENMVDKVLVCLDVTTDVVKEAVEKGCNMIISHHPFIFKGISDMVEENVPAVCAAVRAGITVFSAHTNLDYAPNGINDSLAAAIGLKDIVKDLDGKHTYGNTQTKMTVKELAEDVKARLGVPAVKIILPKGKSMEDHISRVGVSCGAFDSKTYWFDKCGIEVLVTGELKHFDCIDLERQSIITIGAGHYFTEYPGVIKLAEMLNEYGIISEVSEKDRNMYSVV
jgi:dinuclear metal center YbgI/SA1388 family protein